MNSKYVVIQIIIAVLLMISVQVYAQNDWNGKKCAVVLSYDDALNTHLDNVIPLLDSVGLKATFYLPGSFPGFRNRLNDWAAAAKEGHELGNHTLFHPCEGEIPGREWVNPDYDLKKYSLQRMLDEINMDNVLLQALDGKKLRTFAYPCGDMKAGDSSYVERIKSSFIAARSVESNIQKLNDIDLYNIGCYMINNQSGEELISLVKEAMENDALIVFLFHGVGGEHNINVSLEAHRKLIEYLKQNEQSIWIAPLCEIAQFIKQKR